MLVHLRMYVYWYKCVGQCLQIFSLVTIAAAEVVDRNLEGVRQESVRAAREMAIAVRAERRRKCRRWGLLPVAPL